MQHLIQILAVAVVAASAMAWRANKGESRLSLFRTAKKKSKDEHSAVTIHGWWEIFPCTKKSERRVIFFMTSTYNSFSFMLQTILY